MVLEKINIKGERKECKGSWNEGLNNILGYGPDKNLKVCLCLELTLRDKKC